MDSRDLCKRVGIDLPEYQLGVIRRHASARMETLAKQRDCKEYASLGSSVMRCAYAIYLHFVRGFRDKGGISRRLSSADQHVTTALYKRYSLEDYVIVGPSERPGSTHEDIAQRLVAAVYITHGFLRAYDLLEPLFKNVPLFPEGHYKTLVQQYAQQRHLAFYYRIVEKVGPANAPRVTCELRVGNDRTCGTAIGKRNAEVEAAKSFVRRRGIGPDNDVQEQGVRRAEGSALSARRMRALAKARKMLSLGDDCITDRQMDVALTHVSYVNDQNGIESNDALRAVGSCVLDMLVNDCIYNNYVISQASVREVVTRLTSDDRLGKVIPNGLMDFFQMSSSLTNSNLMDVESIKCDILKALLAQIWANYRQTNNTDCRDAAYGLVAGLIESLEDEPLLDYTSLVQQLTQAHDNMLDGKVKYTSSTAGRPVFAYDVSVRVRSQTLRARGIGASKNRARADASRKILPDLLDNSPEDDTTSSIRDLLITGGRLVRKSDMASPPIVDSAHGDGSDLDEYANVSEELDFVEATSAADPDPSKDLQTSSAEHQTGDRGLRSPALVPSTQNDDDEDGDEDEEIEPAANVPSSEGHPDDNEGVPSSRLDAGDDGGSGEGQAPAEPRLYVCIDSYDCVRRGHNTATTTRELLDLEGNVVEAEVCHCGDCGVDLIDYAGYRACRDSHGPLLGSYAIVQRWRAGHVDRTVPDDTPMLAMLGYGVSEALGLTDEQRRLILTNAVEWGSLREADAIAHLRYLCASTRGWEGREAMRARWNEDLKWLVGQRPPIQ